MSIKRGHCWRLTRGDDWRSSADDAWKPEPTKAYTKAIFVGFRSFGGVLHTVWETEAGRVTLAQDATVSPPPRGVGWKA